MFQNNYRHLIKHFGFAGTSDVEIIQVSMQHRIHPSMSHAKGVKAKNATCFTERKAD